MVFAILSMFLTDFTSLIVEKGPIFATRFSQSGQWLLSASLDGTACVWDVKEKKLYMQFRCHAGLPVHLLILSR